MKTCAACKKKKPESEFYKTSGNRCKECHNRRTNLYHTKRYLELEPVRKRKRLKCRQHYQNNKAWYRKRTAALPTIRQRAYSAVRIALKNGTLSRPSSCHWCKKSVQVDAHHADYSRPLGVQWLCSFCHARQHPRCTRELVNA